MSFITDGTAALPPVKSDVRVPTGGPGEWSAEDANDIRQALLDLRSWILDFSGPGVTARTLCWRPSSQGDTTYYVFGPHVVGFERTAAGTYLVTLDKDYEFNEVIIRVHQSNWYDYSTYATMEGLWGSAGGTVGILLAFSVWDTGPAGEKNKRLVYSHGITADQVTGTLTYSNLQSDPIAIELVFVNPAAADITHT